MNKVTPTSKNKKLNKEIKTEFIPHFYDNNEDEMIISLERMFEKEGFDEILYNLKYYESKTSALDINFECIGLPNCCGIIELGELTFNNKILINTYDILFSSLLNAGNGLTFMINTNGISRLKGLEGYLAKSEYFTLVKSFKNPNSSNIIKMWVSNN